MSYKNQLQSMIEGGFDDEETAAKYLDVLHDNVTFDDEAEIEVKREIVGGGIWFEIYINNKLVDSFEDLS